MDKCIDEFLPQHFGEELAEQNRKLCYYCDFQREIDLDEETGDPLPQTKVYEQAYSWDSVMGKAYEFLIKYNATYPSRSMGLATDRDTVVAGGMGERGSFEY